MPDVNFIETPMVFSNKQKDKFADKPISQNGTIFAIAVCDDPIPIRYRRRVRQNST